MSIEPTCPTCGATVLPGQIKVEPSAPAPATPIVLIAPGSDDTNVVSYFDPMATMAEPDPVLGEFIPPSSSETTLPKEAHSGLLSASRANLEVFRSIEFSLMPHPTRERPVPALVQEYERDDSTVDIKGRPAWPMVLIGSYASAVTLAMVWILLSSNGRSVKQAAPEPAIAVGEPADPGHQASLSRKVEPTGPIPEDRILTLGKSIKLDALEVTPIEVRRQSVTLERSGISGKAERRAGGANAMVLRLLVKNTSKDLVFAPLDQTFVREHGRGIVDTYVETSSEERVYPFPLAVESEWSIAGQEFSELRPGESRMVVIVTKADAPTDDSGPFLWRVKLRTGLDLSEVIGVRSPAKIPAKGGTP